MRQTNQISFDPGKESQHILCPRKPVGGSFKILGISFDTRLLMNLAIDDVTRHAKWKVVVLNRVRRFYMVSDMVRLWKSDVLSFIEYRTPAISHASQSMLSHIDALQESYLRDLGLSSLDALVHFNLAPLACRRDIALLGVIHRAVLGLGPTHFHEYFRPPWRWTKPQTQHQRHRYHLQDMMGTHFLEVVRNSMFGLIRIYNLLDPSIIESRSVSSFQAKCQQVALSRAMSGCDDWHQTFSPRIPLFRHPLR